MENIRVNEKYNNNIDNASVKLNNMAEQKSDSYIKKINLSTFEHFKS